MSILTTDKTPEVSSHELNSLQQERSMESIYTWRTLVFRIVLVFGYICFGSGIFCILERNQDEIAEQHNQRLERILNNSCTANDTELLQIKKKIRSVFLLEPEPSFLFGVEIAVQAITTIGYGSAVPKTVAGRLFLIGYATIGIPLMALMLTTIGVKIKHLVRSYIIAFERRILKNGQPQNVKKKSFFVVIAMTVIVLLVISGAYTFLESWCFSLSLYVWFVTFTTIGFGDYVPHGSRNASTIPLEVIFTIFGFFFGLSLMATILHTLGDWAGSKDAPSKESMKSSLRRMASSLSSFRGKYDESENNANSRFPGRPEKI